jgi:glyoxylase I family protein
LRIVGLHHVTLPCTDLERSRRFYRDVIGLPELDRPPFPVPGCWFGLGPSQLHLFVWPDGTFRRAPAIDTRDLHVAIAIADVEEVIRSLTGHGYGEELPEEHPQHIRRGSGIAPFAQVFVKDPDGHILELNAPADFIARMKDE